MWSAKDATSAEFWAAYPTLLERHPDKWVAWGRKGMVGVADTQGGMLRDMKARDITVKDVLVEYFDTEERDDIFSCKDF